MASSTHGKQYSISLLLIIFATWAHQATSRTFHEATMHTAHEQWMARHERVYESSLEKEMRFKIFKANVEFIESFNKAGNHTYTLGINKFTDLTTEEFMASYTGNLMPPSSQTSSTMSSDQYATFKYENLSDMPPSIDWRDEGAVTPVKNQGQCACCWAFTAVAAVEGINQIKTGQLISLSEQEILDCDGKLGGCNADYIQHAYDFIQQNKGLTPDAEYQYNAVEGTCDAGKQTSAAAAISGYQPVPSNDEEALLMAVARQPVSVSVDPMLLQNYQGGIISGECGVSLTHAITAVGYGTSDEDGTKFWIFKNSWGNTWGEDGYVRLQRDIDAKEGMCGIAMNSWYPTA